MEMRPDELAFVIIIGSVLVFSVVCNILVLVIIFKTPKMMNPTNLLICNLTISDIILAGVVIPQNIHDVTHASDNYYEGDFLCRVVNVCPLVCIMGSIYSMVAISWERKRAITLSTELRTTMTQTVRSIPIIWCLALAFCAPTIYEYSEYTEKMNNGTIILRCGSNGVSRLFSIINGVFLLFVAYMVPLVLLLVNYGSILWFFRSHGMFGSGAAAENRPVTAKALYKGRMKVVKMLILVAALFAISWLPYFALLMLEKSTGTSNVTENDGAVFLMKIALTVFSTAYNFFLYVVYNTNFRNGFKALFGSRISLGLITNNSVYPRDTGQNGPQCHSGQDYPSVFTVVLQPRGATTA